MAPKIIILLIFLSLIFYAATSTAISCYSCESIYEPNCDDDFEMENHWKLDCSRVSAPRYLRHLSNDYYNATGCMKRIYRVDGKRRVERGCFFGDIMNKEAGCRSDPSLVDMIAIMDCLVCDNASYCNAAQAMRSTKEAWIATIWSITALVYLSVARIF